MGTFEEIVKQNEGRRHYYIEKLCDNDQFLGLKWKGFHMLHHVYKIYQPNQGVLSTYFNIIIRDRMARLLHEKTGKLQDAKNEEEMEESFLTIH